MTGALALLALLVLAGGALAQTGFNPAYPPRAAAITASATGTTSAISHNCSRGLSPPDRFALLPISKNQRGVLLQVEEDRKAQRVREGQQHDFAAVQTDFN